MRLISCLAIASVLSACGFGFERRSEILDRRILGLRFDPPEFIADGSPLPSNVRVSALVVGPADDQANTIYELRACSSAVQEETAGPATNPLGPVDRETERCIEVAGVDALEAGERPFGEISNLSVNVPIPPSFGAVVQWAASRGIAVPIWIQAQLRVGDEATGLFGLKRFVVSLPLPAGRKANLNPRLAGLMFNGELWPADRTIDLKRNACPDEDRVMVPDPNDMEMEIETCSHRITPAYEPGESEPYQAQQFDGQVVDLQERLRFDWYVDQGSFSDQQTSEPALLGPPKKRDPVSTKWYEPSSARELVRLWVVVRDGRGGETWEARTLRLVD